MNHNIDDIAVPPETSTQFPQTLQKLRLMGRLLANTLLTHGLLTCGALVIIFPFVWMLLASLKDLPQIFTEHPRWLPDPWVWRNYGDSLQALPFDRAYMNSLYISAVIVVLTLLTASMAAYGFARLQFPFREPLFMLFLATMMIPQQMTIIPLYLVITWLGWIDSHLSLIVPPSLFNAFAVFLLRQFIKGLPIDLEEAAIVDGATRWEIYWRIVLPLIRPALASIGIFTFLTSWNNFFHPLIFLNTPDKFTVPLLLNQFRGQYSIDYGLLMAGSAIAILPVLVVYVICQRLIIEGVAFTGLAGR